MTSDPSQPLLFFFLLLPSFLSEKTPQNPPPQFYYKSTSYYKSSHPNTQFASIPDLILQINKTTHFLFKLDFKMLIFSTYFCNKCILFWCLLDL